MASTDIITINNKPVAEYNKDDIALCKRFIRAENATQAEWEKLVLLATKYQLNPLLNEIWIIPGVGVTIGLQGIIKLAIRTGLYDGMQTETKTDANGNPISHTCTVWRKDCSHPTVKTIFHNEFEKKSPNGRPTNWDKMPCYMGEKVAEVHALKRAFSFMDLYIPEEFGIRDNRDEIPSEPLEAVVSGEPVKVERIPKEEPKKLCKICKSKPPMSDYIRQKSQQGFINNGLNYTLPEDICMDCADMIFKAEKEKKDES